MKIIGTLMIVFLVGACASTSKESNGVLIFPNEIEFRGVEYIQVWSDIQELRMAYEYLPEGQALEDWQEMITVHYDFFDLSTSVNLFLEKTEDVQLFEPVFYQNETNGEIIIDAMLLDAYADIVEQNIIRFIPYHNGEHTLKYFIQKRNDFSEVNPLDNEELFIEFFIAERNEIIGDITLMEDVR